MKLLSFYLFKANKMIIFKIDLYFSLMKNQNFDSFLVIVFMLLNFQKEKMNNNYF
jgi:hypothetical protein